MHSLWNCKRNGFNLVAKTCKTVACSKCMPYRNVLFWQYRVPQCIEYVLHCKKDIQILANKIRTWSIERLQWFQLPTERLSLSGKQKFNFFGRSHLIQCSEYEIQWIDSIVCTRCLIILMIFLWWNWNAILVAEVCTQFWCHLVLPRLFCKPVKLSKSIAAKKDLEMDKIGLHVNRTLQNFLLIIYEELNGYMLIRAENMLKQT